MNPSKLNKILALTKSSNENESDAACRMLCKALNSINYRFGDFDNSTQAEDPPRSRRPDPPEPEYHEPKRKPFKKVKEITNRYETYCRICKQHIPEGERVYWSPGEGVVHTWCLEYQSACEA
jgi:hypothetical protein